MSAQTRRVIPPAGSIPRPWPWQLLAAVVLLFAAILVLHSVLKPPLAVSPPVLTPLGDACRVSFEVTNNTERPVSRGLIVSVGSGFGGGKYHPARYVEFARQAMTVSLNSKESRTFSCLFPAAGHQRPNAAHVESPPPPFRVE